MAESPSDQVRRLRDKMAKRENDGKVFSSHYDGESPLLFASPEFTAQSGGIFEGFSDNWCAVVPDTTLERLHPTAFRLGSGELDRAAMEAWRRSEADVEISLALLETLVTSRSFGMVWRPDGGPAEITFDTQGRSIVEYAPGRRNVRSAGMNVWCDGEYEFATLYHPDMVYRRQRLRDTAGGTWEVRKAGLRRGEPADFPNPLGEVPIVEIANRARLRGKPRSEIRNVIPLQNAVNTLWAHLLTASDERALPARAVLGMDRPTRDIIDPLTEEVIAQEDLPIGQFRRDRLMWLESQGASIAEFSAADLTNYTKVIEVAVQHIAAQTRTPPHYLAGQMVNVSADALVASESGLVAKSMEMQRAFGTSIRDLVRLEAKASGDNARAADLALGGVVWRDAQFRSDAQYADALTKLSAIRVPDEALWERIPGVDPDEVQRWKSMRTDQAAAIVGGDMAALLGPKPPAAEAE